MKPKKTSPALPVAVQQWNRLLPMFSRTEASKVTFTVSGDKLYIQAPSQTIKRIADKLALLGAKAEPSSPYGAWGEKTEGESRWPYKS